MDTEYGRNLTEKVSGMSLNDIATSNYSLFQVMKAVEAAEVTIKQQVDENNRLRNELVAKSQVLERLMKSYERVSDEGIRSLSPNVAIDYSPAYSNSSMSRADIVSTTSHLESPSTNNNVNGSLKLLYNRHPLMETTGISHVSSPSTSFSPISDLDPRSNVNARGMIQVADGSNSNWKQEKEYEEEIAQLRNYLAEFSKKEGQIRSEKYALEKRISFMRMAFDQQQQDLVDAASKALSYRQDIIEENVRLTYELQAAQQERSTFVSSLLPLLEDYSLQPVVADAQSIISNIRILFKHLQEKLNHTEAKLKEFEYLSLPWHQDTNLSNSPLRLSPHADVELNKSGLDMVPQPSYFPSKVPVSPGNVLTASAWDFQREYRSGVAGANTKNLENHGGRYSPLGSSAHTTQESPGQFTPIRDEMPDEETTAFESNFGKMMITSDNDPLNGETNERTMIAPYATSVNDQSLYSPYLPPVLEEPTSSFSEAADDDPLPAIRELQISGEAFPGRELQACGYSINGTTSCNFEWVRHLEDGSVNYIEGAKQPTYLVTADDVQAYLAIVVQPLDDRKRKGELVKVFANDHRKITCDPDMQSVIEKHLYSGNASFRVALSTGFLDIWEPAILTIKKDSYSVKCSGPSGVVVTDKFTPNSTIIIPYGQPTEFFISTSAETNHLLRENSTDLESSRDLIVLTFRLFMIRANQKRKGKKRLFFMK